MYEITLSGVNITVLIDTWWNVNMRLLRSPTLLLLVLIDTWWNVNTFISLADTVLQPF